MVSKQKFMARICDIAPPPKERLPDALIQSRRAVERRWNRGRDGGPGPCGSGETGAEAVPAEQEPTRAEQA